MANSHVIKVTITGGKPTVDPDECHVHEGDDIQWKGNEEFKIAFEENTPFDGPAGEKTLAHEAACSSNRVRPGTRQHFFRYSVVPHSNPGNATDPVIIVADPSKGTGGGS